MAIFVVLFPEPRPQLAEKIVQEFAEGHFKLGELQWIISSSLSIIELTAKLGIYDTKEPTSPSLGGAVVFSVSSYYGLGPTILWDWLRAKQEARTIA